MNTCYETEIAGVTIKLEQGDNGKFRVTYGLQVKNNLTYGAAAEEYGCCVFHALACEGLLDNEVEW